MAAQTEAAYEASLAETRSRSAVRGGVRSLEADLHGLRDEHGRVCADLLAGGGDASVVEEVEGEIAAAELELRRAHAAAEYLAA